MKKPSSWLSKPRTMIASMAVKCIRQLARVHKKRGPFRIMSLPAEIRNQIYEIILSAEPREYWLTRQHSHKAGIPALLSTNHILSDEAAGFYWSLGRFEIVVDFDDITPFYRFVQCIGSQNARLLCLNPAVCVRVRFSERCIYQKEFRRHHLLGLFSLSGFVGPTKAMRKWDFTAEESSVRVISECFNVRGPRAQEFEAGDLDTMVRLDPTPGAVFAILLLEAQLFKVNGVVVKALENGVERLGLQGLMI